MPLPTITSHLIERCISGVLGVAAVPLVYCCRSGSLPPPAGRSLRPLVHSDTVMLLEAQNEADEADQVVLQLQDWEQRGYAWAEMALLFRRRRDVS